MLDIAKLSRSTYYYHLKNMDKPDKYLVVKAEIDRIFHENKRRYGYRRITLELKKNGRVINHKTVYRLMKELNLICKVRMKKYKSYKGTIGKIAPNVINRDFKAEKPNEK